MSDYELLNIDLNNGLATITLSRAPLNILNSAMMAEFNSALEQMLTENLAAVVIKATGMAFCAGVDIADHTADKVGDMIGQFHGIFRKLAATDALTVAVVQGAALGGGCELACMCDVVLASARAKFGQPEVQVGVFPPVAACLLPMQVGVRKAVELTTVGATIRADEALRIGLASHVWPTEEFDDRVKEYLDQLTKLSRPVMRLAKRSTVRAFREQFLAELDRAEELYLGELMKVSDAHEGIAAFMEKRSPSWKHA